MEAVATPLDRKLGSNAAADIRTLSHGIADAVLTSPVRCGYAYLCIGARTDYAGTSGPISICPDIAESFCQAILGLSSNLLAQKFETYNLLGAEAALDVKSRKADEMRARVVEMLQVSISTYFIFLLPLLTDTFCIRLCLWWPRARRLFGLAPQNLPRKQSHSPRMA